LSLIDPHATDPRYTRRSALYVPPGEGKTFWTAGDTYTLKVDAADTNGSLALIEGTVPPGGGPEPHVHNAHDEAFYLLSGELEFLNGDESVTAAAGSFFFVPRGTRHRFINRGYDAARMIFFFTPGGPEDLLLMAGMPARRGEVPSPQEAGKPARPGEPGRIPEAFIKPEFIELLEKYSTEALPDPQ